VVARFPNAPKSDHLPRQPLLALPRTGRSTSARIYESGGRGESAELSWTRSSYARLASAAAGL